MRRLGVAVLATTVAVAALAAGPAAVSAISATLFTTSALDERVNVNNDRIRFKTKDPTDVHVQEVRFAPGDVVDWHDHPGFAIISVKSGTMTFYVGCEAHVTGPGEAMVESGGPTKAVNEGTTEALFYVTYVVPRGAPRTVSPVSPPNCASDDAGEDDGEREDDD
jgi:quercetin dioxygenase-like cupin family protein